MAADHTASTHRLTPKQQAHAPGHLQLRILDGPDAPRTIEVDQPLVTVGRSDRADQTVNEHSISSLHFELRAHANTVEVRDLDSTNGLWFAGRRVTGVRELRNTIYRAAYAQRDGVIEPDDLRLGERWQARPDRVEHMIEAGVSLDEIQATVEAMYMARMLERHGDISSISRETGISRATVRRMLQRAGLYDRT